MSRLEPQECLRTSQACISSHSLAVQRRGEKWVKKKKKKKTKKIQFEMSYVADFQNPSWHTISYSRISGKICNFHKPPVSVRTLAGAMHQDV